MSKCSSTQVHPSEPHEKVPSLAGTCSSEACNRSYNSKAASRTFLDLWLASRQGDDDAVDSICRELGERLKCDWVHIDPQIVYKSRTYAFQALHAACFADPDENAEKREKYTRVINTLIDRKANIDAYARSESSDQRELQAIHFAAGKGNVSTLELLLEKKADVDAPARKNEKYYYMPIHDAVWFNQKKCVEVLLHHGCKLESANSERGTILHLAAKLGYEEMARFIIEQAAGASEGKHDQKANMAKLLLEKRNDKKQTPLDVAVEEGQFPPRHLNIFTTFLDQASCVTAYVTVAKKCPAAASALIRVEDENGQMTRHPHEQAATADLLSSMQDGAGPDDHKISDRWRHSLQEGACDGSISVRILADLVEDAPQAAVDLIDALTDTPQVKDREHNPLPVRADIPKSSNVSRISCVYEEDMDWMYDPSAPEHLRKRPWQKQLAPPNSKYAQEVQIRVMKLKGVADLHLLHCLASTSDHLVFTKLVVHGLLKFIWGQFRFMFIVDLLHELLALVLISLWTWKHQFDTLRNLQNGWGQLVERAVWTTVASQGISETVMIVLAGWTCLTSLGWQQCIRWFSRMLHRAVVCGFTVALVWSTAEHFYPADNRILLAVSCFLHWILFLVDLRAFQWSGQRLLPIMKSVQPIAGMLVIMLFLVSAFVHAFWAMDPSGADEIIAFEVIFLLFAGEGFTSRQDLMQMDNELKRFTIFLSIGALFLFLACALNVFIAVLGDCYDQEQERMIATYMKERAKICSSLFLRPIWQTLGFTCFKAKRTRACAQVGFLALLIAIYMVLLFQDAPAWLASIFLSIYMLVFQGILRTLSAGNWEDRYLWLCNEVTLDETMFESPDSRNLMDYYYGRIARIKKYVYEQCREVRHQCKSMSYNVNYIQAKLKDYFESDSRGSFSQRLEEQENNIRTHTSELTCKLQKQYRDMMEQIDTQKNSLSSLHADVEEKEQLFSQHVDGLKSTIEKQGADIMKMLAGQVDNGHGPEAATVPFPSGFARGASFAEVPSTGKATASFLTELTNHLHDTKGDLDNLKTQVDSMQQELSRQSEIQADLVQHCHRISGQFEQVLSKARQRHHNRSCPRKEVEGSRQCPPEPHALDDAAELKQLKR